jgi:hypothetical protein
VDFSYALLTPGRNASMANAQAMRRKAIMEVSSFLS